MLSITMNPNQLFHRGVATIHIVSRKGNQIRIGVEAPTWLKVWRDLAKND